MYENENRPPTIGAFKDLLRLLDLAESSADRLRNIREKLEKAYLVLFSLTIFLYIIVGFTLYGSIVLPGPDIPKMFVFGFLALTGVTYFMAAASSLLSTRRLKRDLRSEVEALQGLMVALSEVTQDSESTYGVFQALEVKARMRRIRFSEDWKRLSIPFP